MNKHLKKDNFELYQNASQSQTSRIEELEMNINELFNVIHKYIDQNSEIADELVGLIKEYQLTCIECAKENDFDKMKNHYYHYCEIRTQPIYLLNIIKKLRGKN